MRRSKRVTSPILWTALCLFVWMLLFGRQKPNPTTLSIPQSAKLRDVDETILATDTKIVEETSTSESTSNIVQPTENSAYQCEYKCRHRHSKYSGAKNMSHKLNHILKRYNRLHDKLLQQLPADHSLQVPLLSKNNTIRYIYLRHHDTDDYGNQFYSLLSTFLLAIITDRVLIVENEHYSQVMCEPFTRSSWFAKTKLFAEDEKIPANVNKALSTRRPLRALHLKLNDENSRAALQCTGNLKEAFSHVQWLVIDDNVGQFVNVLRANKAHDQNLWELFPYGSIFAPLYHALVHPTNQIWEDLPELLKEFSDSSIESPIKMTFVGEDSANKNTNQLIGEFSTELQLENGNRTIALLLSPSTSSMLNKVIDLYRPPQFLVAGSAAHFHGTSELDQYGRFFADIFLAMHSDALLFDSEYQLGWLTHAIRNRPSSMIVNGQIVDVPQTEFSPQKEISCEDYEMYE